MPRKVVSSNCFGHTRAWLKDCLEKHPDCQQLENGQLPTRVIDVGSIDSLESPRLCLGKGESGSWVTLSHRWGNQKITITTKSNINDHLQTLPISSLSPTFRDAVTITRELGFQYLWIDSLCIIQDCEDDWIQESARMGTIYKNSVVTIAASHPSSETEGILADRRSIRWSGLLDSHIEIPYHGARSSEEVVIYAREPMQPFDDIIDMKYFNLLQRRGWILQETVLSPRTIHWSQEQMIWHCQTCVQVEADSKPIYASQHAFSWANSKTFLRRKSDVGTNSRSGEDPPIPTSASINTLWLGLVVDFCNRQLTYKDDTFPAISGMAKEIHSITTDTYCAGIWKSDIHRGLLWSFHAPLDDTEEESYLAPSWSWAAKSSTADDTMDPYFYMLNTKEVEEEPGANMEVIDFHRVLKTADPFGKLLDGRLTVRGWTRSPYFVLCTPSSPTSGEGSEDSRSSITSDESQEEIMLEPMLNYFDETTGIRYSLDNHTHQQEFQEQNNFKGSFLVLAVAELQGTANEGDRFGSGMTSGLLLREKLSEPGSYIRVGLIEVSTEVSREEPWQLRLCTLV